jgi:hypothetical protein
MDAQALAATPLFTISLVLCALLTVCGFTMLFKSMLSRAAVASATRGLQPNELKSVEVVGLFHKQVEALLDRLSTVEQLSSEMAEPFHDPCWNRLLELYDELEAARHELNALLHTKDFNNAATLGSFLTGASKVMPEFLGVSTSIDLHKLRNWEETARNLLQRFITLLHDAADSRATLSPRRLSSTFYETLRQVKSELASEEE